VTFRKEETMSKIIQIILAIIISLHGLIHLMGPAVYMKLTEIQGFSYKTTLIDGRWNLGEKGIRVFGALWIVPALGFILAAVALLAGWVWFQPALIVVTLISLVLTILDYRIAYAGVIINILILAGIWLAPRVIS
jgi:hypothetical protein